MFVLCSFYVRFEISYILVSKLSLLDSRIISSVDNYMYNYV